MATLNVCCRLSSKPERFQVSLSDFDKNVDHLEQEIRNKLAPLNSKDVDFDIIYCGQVLKSESKISNYQLQSYSTVYVVRKFSSRSGSKNTQHPEGSSQLLQPSKMEIAMAIQAALLNPDFKNIVEQLINDPQTVENLIGSIPGLDEDPAVLSMLQEPDLLAVLAHRNSLDSLLQQHPAFGPAAVRVCNKVTEEGAKRGASSRTAENLTYSMDQMSDEEDDAPRAFRGRGGNPGGSNITTSQLAAAIQAVTGAGSIGSAGGASAMPPIQSTSQGAPGPSSSATITSDFFQQAMAHAQSASTDTALQQLREMGITDENVARQALAATGGDIQAAIDLIFGDGLM